METMGVENPYYRRSIKQTSYAKKACWYYPTTNTEDTDMEDVEYRVEIYNIQEDGTKTHDKTNHFFDLEEAGASLLHYTDKKRGYFAIIRIETYEE